MQTHFTNLLLYLKELNISVVENVHDCCFIHLQPCSCRCGFSKRVPHIIKEVFPPAIWIADHFYVNRYVTESLQLVQKQVNKDLSTHAFNN
jgi:hypothetical protein